MGIREFLMGERPLVGPKKPVLKLRPDVAELHIERLTQAISPVADISVDTEFEADQLEASANEWLDSVREFLDRAFDDPRVADSCLESIADLPSRPPSTNGVAEWAEDFQEALNLVSWRLAELTSRFFLFAQAPGTPEPTPEENEALAAKTIKEFNARQVSDTGRTKLSPAKPARATGPQRPMPSPAPANVFVVHGHHEARKLEVARYIDTLGLKSVILHEEPNQGRTVIEKLEHCGAQAAFAVILMTADDVGATAPAVQAAGDVRTILRPRARPNVLIELGYFIGKLGRKNVAVLVEESVEIPSDASGVLYIPLSGNWKDDLRKELRAASLIAP